MNKLKVGLPLIAFGVITILGVIAFYFNIKWLKNLYATLDTSSAVALAVLAFIAYFQYANEKKKKMIYKDQLAKVSSLTNKDGLIGIQFGGSNPQAHLAMEKFAKEKGIDDNMCQLKSFGDEDNTVTSDDLITLETFLKEEAMPMLSGADKIHVLVAGVGIAFYVVADILSNWKPVLVYHNNKGNYEYWYLDNKHRPKIEAQKPRAV